MKNLIEKAVSTHSLTREELILLLKDSGCDSELFAAADDVRRTYVGNGVHLRGLIEFSNFCRNNCCYCGLRRDNRNIFRYRIDEETIFRLAEHAVTHMGLKTIVLQSGEDLYFTQEKLCALIRRIKTLDTALTLSIGEKTAEEYQAYKAAGADRFLLRIETTDKKLYLENDPGMNWENRVECIKNLKKSGLETGTGVLVGLPGQTIDSLADDILFFKSIPADMIGIGPLIPHPDTPLAKVPAGSFLLALKVMALTRLLLKSTRANRLPAIPRTKAFPTSKNALKPSVVLPSDFSQKSLSIRLAKKFFLIYRS